MSSHKILRMQIRDGKQDEVLQEIAIEEERDLRLIAINSKNSVNLDREHALLLADIIGRLADGMDNPIPSEA